MLDHLVSPEVWTARRDAHETRVAAWVDPHLARRGRGEAHPVEDFLFTYYRHSPARLRRWHPAAYERLAGPGADAYAVDLDQLAAQRPRLDDVRRLLVATASRPAAYGCFGLHEWAMVHGRRQQQVRHPAWPLRLGESGTAAVVESLPVRCTHFDAFRFFTDSARPLNVVQPTRGTQVDLEQPGCLHAGMDLYKWAYTFDPFVAAELVADCFALARDIRVLDMRASPYDLTGLGYDPVRVETPEGRQQYASGQRVFAHRGALLRQRLVDELDRLAGVRLSSPPAR